MQQLNLLRIRVLQTAHSLEPQPSLDLDLSLSVLSFIAAAAAAAAGLLQPPAATLPVSAAEAYGQLHDEPDGNERPAPASSSACAATGRAASATVAPAADGEAHSSWWAVLVFAWVGPVLSAGSRKQLDQEDLVPLSGRDQTKQVGADLMAAWATAARPQPPDQSTAGRQLAAAGGGGDEAGGALLWALGQVFGRQFCALIPTRVCGDMLTFVSPLVLQSLLTYVERGATQGGDRGLMVDCVLLALGILVVKTAESLLICHYFQGCFRCGWQIRAAVTGLVYRKVLRLSCDGTAAFNVGDVVTMVSLCLPPCC